MKVLYFHQHFSTPQGSTGTRSYEMAKRLISKGHQVKIVCGSYGGAQTGLKNDFVNGRRTGFVEEIEVIELNLAYSNKDNFTKRTWTFVKFAIESILIALKEDYDLVFCTSTPLTAGIPGIFARWLRLKPFVFEVRDLWPELPRAMGVIKNPLILGAMSVLEWISYHSAHRLIGLSPGIVEGIHKRGISRSSIAMIPNGCDLNLFSSTQESVRPQGIAPDDFVAIFMGTHGVANGLDALLNVGRELKKRNINNIKILLVGDGKLKPQLVAQAKQESLESLVFLAPVRKEELIKLVRSCQLGLQILANIPAFYFGTSPNKFFDYIASGLPVLINYPGWLAQKIIDTESGYAIKPDNQEEFVDGLIHARDHRELLQSKGRNALSLAKQEFDRDILADQWILWLEGCAS